MQRYAWKRFWCPREGTIHLVDDGFLSYPEGSSLLLAPPDVRSFAEIADKRCLVLLGEPGIGKTTALEAEAESLQETIETEGDSVRFADLRGVSSAAALYRFVFDHPTFAAWQTGTHQLHLFLDGLDETGDPISIGRAIANELELVDRHRLRLRLSCRTASWEGDVEQRLRRLWSDVGVYELVPLRRTDVVAAAEVEGLDGSEFVAAVLARDVVPLAIKPITLSMLLSVFATQAGLPESSVELYRRACLLLCEEHDPNRPRFGNRPQLSAAERLEIAAHVAAVTVLSRRSTIWTGRHQDAPPGAVPLSDLSNTSVPAIRAGRGLAIDEDALRDVLDTGLFSARGANGFGFAHQSYGEFLAADRVLSTHLPEEQIMGFLVAGDGERARIPRAAVALVGWLTTLSDELLERILAIDPLVVLGGELTSVDAQTKPRVVEALIDKATEDMLPFELRRRLAVLCYPGLGERLREVLASTGPIGPRQMAVELAEACHLPELATDLAAIALDTGESDRMRIYAAGAVAFVGDREARVQLRPLLDLAAAEDPSDELFGYALAALWPQVLSTDELLAALRPPRRPNLFGTYSAFLTREFADGLTAADLPAALRWAMKLSAAEREGPFEEAVDAIVIAAIETSVESDPPEGLADLVTLLLKRDHKIFSGYRAGERRARLQTEEVRHRLLPLLSAQLASKELNPFDLTIGSDRLVALEDIPWLLAQLKRAHEEKEQRAWAELVAQLWRPTDEHHVEAVLEAAAASHVLAEALAPLLDPVVLDSDRARSLRSAYEQRRSHEQRVAMPPPIDPPPEQRINQALDRYEACDPDAWVALSTELLRDDDDPRNLDQLRSDLRASRYWHEAAETNRQRILDVAATYLRDTEPQPEEWFGKKLIHVRLFAGYRALRLLLDEDPDRLARLDGSLWGRWAPAVVGFLTASEGADARARGRLMALAYRYAADETLKWIEAATEAEAREAEGIWTLRLLEAAWDDRLDQLVSRLAADETLPLESRVELLRVLLRRGSPTGSALAESWIAQRSDDASRPLAVGAAAVLLSHASGSFEHVFAVLSSDRTLGKEMIAAASQQERFERRLSALLDENQLAQLYAFVEEEFPHAEDPAIDGAHFVSPREELGRWRDGLLRELESRATPAAVDSLRMLQQRFPGLPWLTEMADRAETMAIEQAWVVPEPADVIALLADPEKRYVESGDDLVAVLLEALGRADAYIQGELSPAREVWDRIEGGYRPIPEDDLSRWLARFLRRDLGDRDVIVNREVEVSGIGPGIGNRTDIRVEATSTRPDAVGRLTVILEVKGCWNPDLETDLERQLVERYLKAAANRFGIYVVGWFSSPHWKAGRDRTACARHPKDELHALLDEQAARASVGSLTVRAAVLDLSLS